MKANLLQQNIRRVVAGLLVVWMSGVIVLFCCKAASASAASDEIENCPLAQKNGCSKTSVKDSGQFFGQESLAFDCCSFPAKIFDKVRNLETAWQPSKVTEKVEIAAPEFFAFEKTFKTLEFGQSFVRNRGSTYLRNRVLRI